MEFKLKAYIGMVILLFVVAVLGAVTGNAIYKSPSQRAEEFYSEELFFRVSPTDLKARMDNGYDDFVLIDVRDAVSYEKGHMKGAISMPYSAIEANYMNLPKGKELIVYCWSHSCMLSRKAGLKFAELGIHVKELNIGWEEWYGKGFPVEGEDITYAESDAATCSDTSESC